MNIPLVIVVEDDETLQQFFGMVLEMLPVEQHLCTTAEEALEILSARDAAVIVTDLLLPGLDGRSLLRQLQANPARQASVRTVVMSGSIDDSVRRELKGLGAWRVLAKPVTVKAFKECIQAALDEAAAPLEISTALEPEEQAALTDLFEGNEVLFKAYREASMKQLPVDLARGDAALESGDPAALRLLAHNLKGVLRTLGRAEASLMARSLEDASALARPNPELKALWLPLRAAIGALLARRSA